MAKWTLFKESLVLIGVAVHAIRIAGLCQSQNKGLDNKSPCASVGARFRIQRRLGQELPISATESVAGMEWSTRRILVF